MEGRKEGGWRWKVERREGGWDKTRKEGGEGEGTLRRQRTAAILQRAPCSYHHPLLSPLIQMLPSAQHYFAFCIYCD